MLLDPDPAAGAGRRPCREQYWNVYNGGTVRHGDSRHLCSQGWPSAGVSPSPRLTRHKAFSGVTDAEGREGCRPGRRGRQEHLPEAQEGYWGRLKLLALASRAGKGRGSLWQPTAALVAASRKRPPRQGCELNPPRLWWWARVSPPTHPAVAKAAVLGQCTRPHGGTNRRSGQPSSWGVDRPGKRSRQEWGGVPGPAPDCARLTQHLGDMGQSQAPMSWWLPAAQGGGHEFGPMAGLPGQQVVDSGQVWAGGDLGFGH